MAADSPNPLFSPNPWPFNDGMLFFHDHMEQQSDQTGGVLVIPHVLQNDQASDLVVKRIGVGKIGARFMDKDGVSSETRRIWCEWLGNVDSTTEEVDGTPKHGFAIVTFSYTHNLGLQDDSGGFDRTCDICQQGFFPSKDVAALLNLKTGKLVCSTRNFNGVFHIFHVSCLIQWILIFEVGSFSEKLWEPVTVNETKAKKERKHSVFCSDCRGTGIIHVGEGIPVDEDGKPIVGEGIPKKYRERPYHKSTEISEYRNILRAGHNAWMESPEVLDNCSLGFYFPQQHDEIYQETVAPLKLLEFYRADD